MLYPLLKKREQVFDQFGQAWTILDQFGSKPGLDQGEVSTTANRMLEIRGIQTSSSFAKNLIGLYS